MAETHHLLLLEYVEDVVERRTPYRESHLARIRAELDSGRIVMAGALGDPAHAGAIVFRDVEPDEIEEFVRSDPYSQAGLVTGWRIERWNLV